MATLLRDAASGVRDAQSVLRAAEEVAAQNRLTIGPDGSVSASSPPPLMGRAAGDAGRGTVPGHGRGR